MTTSSCSLFVPAGSYQGSASDISVTLTAACLDINKIPIQSSLSFNTSQLNGICDIANDNGSLQLVSGTTSPVNTNNPFIPAGSYQNSSSVQQIIISASCKTLTGSSKISQLPYLGTQAASLTDIMKNNGNLGAI
ncbi:MAG: hypothetical protein ACK5RA_14430 [Cyanobacteriota bacterium]